MKTLPSPSSLLKQLQTHITSKFKSLYTFQSDYYNINIINQIICNDCAHIVAVFKDYLIYGDHSEFLQGMYTIHDSNDILPKIYEYYESCSVIFPNYIALPESKYIYKNIQRKQRVIDNQQELELEEERKKNMKIQNSNNNNNSGSNTLNKVFNTQAVDSILNQTNTSNIRMIMGLPKLFGGCGGGNSNSNSNSNNKQSEEMSLCYNNNNKEDDEMIKQFEKVVDVIEQSEFWSEVNKRKIVNCALRKKQSKNISSNTHMNGNGNGNGNTNSNNNNNHNTCLQNNNSKSKRKQSKSKAHTNNTSKTNNNNNTTTNHSHVIRGRNYNRVNSINISSIIKMNSTSERDLKLSTNRTMRNFSKGASIIHNTKKENKTINATSSSTTRHKHHKSQVVKKGIVNLLLSVNFDLIKRTFEEIAKKNTHQCNANNEHYHSSVNKKTHHHPHHHVRSSSHSRNPFTSTIVKLSDKILGISSVNVNNRMRRSGKYKSKEKEEHKCQHHIKSNQDNGNVALTSRESLKHVTNMNQHYHQQHHPAVASSTSVGGTATGSLGPQSNDDVYISNNNNNTKDCVVVNTNKHINKNKPLSHRNKRNNNNNNINGCCCHFSKTSVVHFNFKKPPLSNTTNKVLQTCTHFKSVSFHNKQHSNNSTTTHKSKKKLTIPNNVVIPIRKDLNIKGIHIKGFDELLLKHNNNNNNCCNGGIPSSERSSENNSNLKLSNNYALKSKTSRQRSRFNYLQGHSTYNINNNNIFKTTKH